MATYVCPKHGVQFDTVDDHGKPRPPKAAEGTSLQGDHSEFHPECPLCAKDQPTATKKDKKEKVQ